MINWLRTMVAYIWNNKNRRITTIFILADVVGLHFALNVFDSANVAIIAACVMAYAVSTITREHYLTLGASCIAAMQILLILLLQPTLKMPIVNTGLVLLASVIYILLMMSMITNIQQQEYYSTVEADRQILYKQLMNALLKARGVDNIYGCIINAISELYGRSAAIFNYLGEEFVCVCREPVGLILYQDELKAAKCAFDTGRIMGRFGNGCEYSSFMLVPIKSFDKVLAVVGIMFGDDDELDYKTNREITELIAQSAKPLEYQLLADEQQRIIIENERESIRANLLRAMSHDIRSPLTGIMSASSTILQSGDLISDDAKEKLLINIHEEAEWLTHMVENLLSITRVNGSMAPIKKSLELVEDILGEVQKRCQTRFPQVELNIISPDEPLVVPMDATLIIQVLMNLIENAVKYCGGCNYIEVTVRLENEYAVFSVRDYGIGLSAETKDKLFSPIEHTDADISHGLGIGLSICKSVIRAHGGEIKGENGPECGALFTFTLPLEDTENEQNDSYS